MLNVNTLKWSRKKEIWNVWVGLIITNYIWICGLIRLSWIRECCLQQQCHQQFPLNTFQPVNRNSTFCRNIIDLFHHHILWSGSLLFIMFILSASQFILILKLNLNWFEIEFLFTNTIKCWRLAVEHAMHCVDNASIYQNKIMLSVLSAGPLSTL